MDERTVVRMDVLVAVDCGEPVVTVCPTAVDVVVARRVDIEVVVRRP